jgi:elongation factor P
MNSSTYEQEFLSKDQVCDAVNLLKDNTVCTVLFFQERAIGLTLPNFVSLKVVQSDPWAKGDTATGSTKPATLETGFEIQVPPFIDEGQVVKIDTRTCEYVERVNE